MIMCCYTEVYLGYLKMMCLLTVQLKARNICTPIDPSCKMENFGLRNTEILKNCKEVFLTYIIKEYSLKEFNDLLYCLIYLYWFQ